MSSRNAQPSLFEPDTLMQAAELEVLKDEYRRALQEPPWDGEQSHVSALPLLSFRLEVWHLSLSGNAILQTQVIAAW